ncbi:MAG TPA: diacylglycerol kinase family protein [Kiritimatiellia bacterium]|nr:diacylglycerol kinase family protein [Kiritimatiellia bacterium]
MHRLRVIVNPKSGFGPSMGDLAHAVEQAWRGTTDEITYQFSHDIADSQAKVEHAKRDGVRTLLVAGGDGMINSIGSALLGSDIALGVLPCGSGNGFARHFNIPLDPAKAAAALVGATAKPIDVAIANDRPFIVTCGMAWDAALVRSYEKSPIRGILPYVLAGAVELLEYKPQLFRFQLDHGPWETMDKPMIFTAANLTQYGGGARIAPTACENDGFLELVAVKRADAPFAAASFTRLFNGTIDRVEGVHTRRFKRLHVIREHPDVIQLDGELVQSPPEVVVTLHPQRLNVLIP